MTNSMTTHLRDHGRVGARVEFFTIVMKSAGVEAPTRTLKPEFWVVEAGRPRPPAGVLRRT